MLQVRNHIGHGGVSEETVQNAPVILGERGTARIVTPVHLPSGDRPRGQVSELGKNELARGVGIAEMPVRKGQREFGEDGLHGPRGK